jgi:D-3-phosphoglycerate dehydrogenase
LGLLGWAIFGKIVAQKFVGAFECRILGYDPVAPKDAWPDVEHVRVGSIEELVREADVVTLHVPLLKSTKGLIGERELGIMK